MDYSLWLVARRMSHPQRVTAETLPVTVLNPGKLQNPRALSPLHVGAPCRLRFPGALS